MSGNDDKGMSHLSHADQAVVAKLRQELEVSPKNKRGTNTERVWKILKTPPETLRVLRLSSRCSRCTTHGDTCITTITSKEPLVYEKCLSCVAAHQKCSHSPVAAGSAPAVGRAVMNPQISEELDGIERRLAAVVGEEARMTEVVQGCRTRLEVTQQTVTKAQVDVQESEDAWRKSTEEERLAFEAMVAAQEHWQTMVRETHSKADEVRTARTKKQPLADKLESEKKELEVLEVKLEKTVKTKLGLEEDIKEWKALEEMYERVSKRARLA